MATERNKSNRLTSKPKELRLFGIGRPNLEMTTDFAGTGTPVAKFTIHMEIPITPGDVAGLTNDLKSSMSKKDRKDLKTKLKKLMQDAKVSTKGGRALVDGLADNPDDDSAP